MKTSENEFFDTITGVYISGSEMGYKLVGLGSKNILNRVIIFSFNCNKKSGVNVTASAEAASVTIPDLFIESGVNEPETTEVASVTIPNLSTISI